MTLVRRLTSPRAEERSTVNLSQYIRWVADSTLATSSGVYVDQDTAMRHDAVWSCVTAIAQDVSMMPVDVVRYVNGQRQEVTPQPRIIANPSSVVSSLDWRYQVVESWLTDGNAVGRVTDTDASMRYPTRIELMDASKVQPDPNKPGAVLIDGASEDLWPVGPIWHVPAYLLPGSWWGSSPIEYHRAKIGGGLAAEKFGHEFFGAGGVPVSILTVDGQTPTEEQAKQLKTKFLSSSRTREPVVLPGHTKYQQVQINPSDSQFIDSQRYTVEQVCRIFREDPADHGASSGGTSMTYANRSDADLARYKRRQFWVVKLQSSLTALLPQPQVVRLNTSAALMMTPRERHELHALRLNSRTTTVNEVRTVEDEAPFPGDEFDEPGIPDPPAPTDGGAAA